MVGVGIDVREAVRLHARPGARRSLAVRVGLGVLVALSAGMAGTTHFSGPRWVPHFGGAPRSGAPARPAAAASAAPHLVDVHGRASFPVVPLLGAAAVLAVLGAAYLLWRLWTGRPSPAAPGLDGPVVDAARAIVAEPEPEPEPEPESAPEPERLRTGIELALAVLDEQREPADAVVRAWLGLQETAEQSGIVRRPAETPTELTTRILARVVADDRALRTLLRLYLQVRFGDHPVTGEDVAAVRAALGELVRSWRDAVPTPASAR